MTVLNRDKTLAGYNGNLESVVIYDKDGNEKVETTNGVFVTLHGLEEGIIGSEAMKAQLTTADDATNKNVLLISNPEVIYDERLTIDDYKNEAGKVVRAFRLFDGDVISVTEDLLEEVGEPEVGQTLAVGEDGKLVVPTATGEEETAPAPAIQFIVEQDRGYALTTKQKAWRLAIKIG